MHMPFEIVEILISQLDDKSIQSLIAVNTTFLTHIRKIHNTSEYWKTRLLNSVSLNPKVPSNAMIHRPETIKVYGDELQFWKKRYRHYAVTLDGNIFVSRDPSIIALGLMIYSNRDKPGDFISVWNPCADYLDGAMFHVIEHGFYESFMYLLDRINYYNKYTDYMINHGRYIMLRVAVDSNLVDINSAFDHCVEGSCNTHIVVILYELCYKKMEKLLYAAKQRVRTSVLISLIDALETDDFDLCQVNTCVKSILKLLKGQPFEAYCDYLRNEVGSTEDEFMRHWCRLYDETVVENARHILLKYGVITWS